jgi:acyl-CoA dehydrogenase
MVFAMHQIQVACLSRHGGTDLLRDVLTNVGRDQLLLASATTELGTGGDVRTSLCALEGSGDDLHLTKQAPVISYGEQADAVLVTTRRSPDSPPSDQVLVYCAPPELALEPTGEWDALGFRGTCSRGFRLQWAGPAEAVLTDPYGDISAETMLPVSHVLWASVWLGIAEGAGTTAHRFVKAQARPDATTTPPAAARLAELAGVLQQLRGIVAAAAAQVEDASDDPRRLTAMRVAASLNTLKVSASTLALEIVTRAFGICGMAAYRLDSPYSLGRSLRDIHGAALMVSNERILLNTAGLLLASKEL